MQIHILDTTLRDGEQMAGVNLNPGDKVRIAYALAHLGVDAIEAGFPISSKMDYEAVSMIAEQIRDTIVVALARAERSDIDCAYEALAKAAHPRLHIFIATSDLHLSEKLRITREECLRRVQECVAYARTLCDDVEFSPEDATRSDPQFLALALETAIRAGATMINIPDTVGYTVPVEFGAFIAQLRNTVPGLKEIPLSVHCHNDLGLAVANSIEALKNGATWVDCTVNGLGERTGNASLEEIVMALKTREDVFDLQTAIHTPLLYKTCRLVSEVTGVYIPPNKPIVGRNAFLHEAGIHQHGVLADRRTYEIMTPESVGINESGLVLGKHSGHHAFAEKLEEMGIRVDEVIQRAAFEAFKNLCCRKKEISDDDIRALVEEALIDSRIIDGYELKTYQTQSGNDIKAMSMITLTKGKDVFSEAAIGEGPIDASFNAINRLIKKDYKLISYNIKAVTGGTDALGEVRVRISDGTREYVGKGISTDIIASSIKAYINAINRAALNL